MKSSDLSGVTVATILPFDESGAIDWPSYARVLEHCAVPDTIAAVFVNGHAGEATSLDAEERVAVIRRTREIIGSKPLLAGVVPLGVYDAIAQAREAEAAGADAIVIFPPAALGGGAASTAAPVEFCAAVTAAVSIPASVFQFPLASGLGYSTQTLVDIAKLPKVIAVKEGSNTMLAYEENFRALRREAPDVAMLPSNFDWFLPQLAVGADGLLSGLASLAPTELHALWDAAARVDLAAMRTASDALHPLVRTVYGAAPIVDMHTRIKVALEALGIITCARPRLPLMAVTPAVADTVRRTVRAHMGDLA
ncbi:dihydrodipicolinate synthase family protein [Acuticoccus sp. MNP-M23]|uniref:dihydrodipicolinate synthase family protein n=1 Tax=Acuticoccus sp. MNP-M23 TaxID=3072793 RepID=UPI002815CB8E|nr:dihydrodipicolinate synthase family protein [Acuticoccus sp. MNP-M23]WMS42935.1 dihydrodipicolinate synthase family protein [Acuticoccus sp. MNP-M23]